MNNRSKKQPTDFILACSILAISFSFGKAFIDEKIEILSLVFGLMGLAGIVYAWLKINPRKQRMNASLPTHRIQSIVLIFALVLILFDVNYFAHRWDVRIDVTKEKLHTLSPETIGLIQSLNQDVKLTSLYVGFPPKYLDDLLNEYASQSKGRIKIEIVDPIADIGYAAQFGNIINGKESKLVVQSEQERKDIDFSQEVLTEELINNALINVTRTKRTAYFLKGHQEYEVDNEDDNGLSKFADILRLNNFEIAQLVIGLKGQVPDNCDVLVIAGPKDELTPHEEEAVNAYLEKGGDAFVMIENIIVTTADKPLKKDEEDKNPSLNNILRKWGIEVAKDIVLDLANHAGKDVGSPATKNYMAHRAIVKSLDYTFYVRPRSIKILDQRKSTIKLAPLVVTTSETQSWGETNRTLKVKYDEGIDRPGPVPIAFVISEPKDDKKTSATRLIVFTDADFLTNVYIDSYSNAEMGLNVMYWLTDLDYKPMMGNKNIEVKRLDLTSREKRQVVVVLVFIPIIILIAGLIFRKQ